MPITGFVLRNCVVGIDGVDLSDHIREVGVEMSAADVSVTAMGSGGQQHLAGIRDDNFTFSAYSDFAAGKIHATINPKFVSAGTFEVKVAASGSTIGTANPLFIGYCPALTYNPVSGGVGDAAMTPLSFPVNGTITVAITGTIP
jgi:hypothetical protein